MDARDATPRGSRETRLLLVTIAVSIGVLLLLARFRFPEEPAGQAAEPAPAPLERLAARAAYEELASVMADLERRVSSRVTVVRMQSPEEGTSLAIAPRMLPDRAVAIARPGQEIIGIAGGGDHELIGFDTPSSVAVMRVPAIEDSAVAVRQTPLRTGPRYVGLVEPSASGPLLRPVYVGRIETFQDPRTGTALLALAGLQSEVPPGSALFSLEGMFVGLVRDVGNRVVVIPAEQLRSTAEKAQAPGTPLRGDLGIEVDTLTGPLMRATGAEQGAIVVHVRPGGPADGVLHSGDVVQSIDGLPIANSNSFREVERSRGPGASVIVTAIRDRSPLQVTVTAADVTARAAAADDVGVIGRGVRGVGFEVVALRDGSAAAHAGFRRGDLVIGVNGETAPDPAALDRWFSSAEIGASLLVTIQRDDQHRVLALEKR